MTSKDSKASGGGTLRDELWIKATPSFYSLSQVTQYLSRIGFELPLKQHEVLSQSFPADLYNLGVLQRLHLLSFPYENTTMHYTADHSMDVSPEGVFRHLVLERKGGSYCCGQNTLFLGMLRGLGYRAYGGAARVNEAPPGSEDIRYTPLTHMTIFVQPIADSNETYLVDVGFGGNNLASPILLSDAETNIVWGAAPPERHRLSRGIHPSTSLETHNGTGVRPSVDWHLETTRDFENPTWSILYSFSENEFYTADIEAASFGVSRWPGLTFFRHNIVILKYFLLGEEEDRQIETIAATQNNAVNGNVRRGKGTWLGKYIVLGSNFKRQVGGRSETIKEFRDEIERIHAIRELGIDVEDGAAKYIQGSDAALGSNSQR